MADNLVILSSNDISRDEFNLFVKNIGGMLKPDGIKDAQISRGWNHLWLFFCPQTLIEVIEDIGEKLASKLGDTPKTCIVLELSQTGGTEKLALEFAIAFAERWHSVLGDAHDRLLTLEDMRRALKTGERLGVSD